MTATFTEIPPDLLAHATDQELDVYIAALEAELLAQEKDWRLNPRQQQAEDLCTDLDPTKAHELLYGGAAGGGKSQWMLWHLYHLALKYPGFKGLLVRRTNTQLKKTHVIMSLQRFDRTLCAYNQVDKMWKFSNGSMIEFGYLDSAVDVYNYDSAEYDCVAPETEILMGDGSYRRIDAVRAGDYVETLEGPRRVLRSQSVGVRPSVTASHHGVETTLSLRHRVLDSEGRWRTPEDFAVSSADGRTGSATSDGLRQGRPQPRQWTAQLTLLARRSPSTATGTETDSPPRVPDRERAGSAPRGWLGRCLSRLRSGGAPTRAVRGADRARTPSRADAAAPAPTSLLLDDRPRTPTRSHERPSYSHPYTTEARPLAAGVRQASVGMVPAGERELWDLQVEGANHYVSYGGIVHSNCIAFDELTQWPDDQNYLYLFSRIRTQMHLVEQGLVGHMISGTNPGRVGGAWVKSRFVDFAEPMERVDVEDPESDAVTTRVFVPAKIDDNPHFNRRQYRAMLMNVDAKRRRQLEDGDWDAIEGAYFTEWDRGLHVITPFELPDYWTKIRGLDFGYAKPMGVLWACFDPDGNCYIYRELYGTGMLATYQARRVNELTQPGENVDYTIADPSIWIRSGIGPPIAEQYARAGLRCRKANNARIDGWMRVREYLRVDEKTGLPKLFVFDHCKNLIRTLPMLVHDTKNPEDLDTDGEDHAADCLARGTLVTTRRGEIPIEEVRVGDEVLNTAGWQPVSDQWLVHDDADVLRIVTSDGSITTATPSHRFWTEEHGWIEAGALRYGDTLVSCDTKMWSSTGARTAASPTTSYGSTGSTSGRWAARVRRFIGRCGSLLTARSPKASTSITSTTTPSTTTSPTSGSSPQVITLASTGESAASAHSSASNAETSSRRVPSMVASGSARTTASRNGDASRASTSSRRSARGVVSRLNRTGTTAPSVVPVSVVSVIADERKPVYDLTVDGEPEFFANGILVHNSLRYLLMSRPRRTRDVGLEAASLDERHYAAVQKRRHDRLHGGLRHPELGSI